MQDRTVFRVGTDYENLTRKRLENDGIEFANKL